MNRTTSASLMLVAVSLILSACTSLLGQLGTAASTPEPSASPTPFPLPTITRLPDILPTPSAVDSLNDRLLASINIAEHPLADDMMIGNSPDEIVLVQGQIWTRTANGHLVQIEPVGNRILGAVKVDSATDPNNHCQGLGTDGMNVWTCAARDDDGERTIDVARVDPRTRRVVQTIRVDKIFDQFDMPYLVNRIWVLVGGGDQLVGIDSVTNRPGQPIDLGTRCFQLAAAGDTLLATCSLDNQVIRIDPQTREVITRATISNPRLISAAGDSIWVTQDNELLRLDPQTLNPVVAFTHLPSIGLNGDIFVAEDAVWVRLESGFLYRIDPATNEIVEQVQPPEVFTGGSVIATADSVWTTAIDDYLLLRLTLR